MILHKLEIIHRDIKLENIVINDKGEIRLIDFGFCTSYKYDKLGKYDPKYQTEEYFDKTID